MYIKIKDNKLTDWADWEFDGSTFVNIDYKDFNENKDRFKIVNNEILDIKEDENYKISQRIKEIDFELQRLDELYYQAGQAPVEYQNHLYKFDWTSLYQGLLESEILPAKIWDLTELEQNAVVMDKEQLQNLQTYLLTLQESAFQTRKTTRSLLLNEKSELEKKLKSGKGE